MKTIVSLIVITLFVRQHSIVFAQARSEASFWVIESNKNTPRSSMIKFYDTHHAIIAEVQIEKNIDISKKRHVKRLNRMLAMFNHHQSLSGAARKYRFKSAGF